MIFFLHFRLFFFHIYMNFSVLWRKLKTYKVVYPLHAWKQRQYVSVLATTKRPSNHERLAIEFHAHMLKWAWRCDGEICDFLKCHIKTKMYERNNLIFLAECKIPDEIENLPCNIHFICFFMTLVWAKGRKGFRPFAQTRFLLKVAQCRNISGCMSFCVVLGSWWIVGRPGHPFCFKKPWKKLLHWWKCVIFLARTEGFCKSTANPNEHMSLAVALLGASMVQTKPLTVPTVTEQRSVILSTFKLCMQTLKIIA